MIGVRLRRAAPLAQENRESRKEGPPNPFDAYIHVKPDGKISSDRGEIGDGAGNQDWAWR